MKLNWAERWAVNNPIRILQQHLEIRWLKDQRPLMSGSRILEIGCGRGAGAAIIHREFRPLSLYAMDLDFQMIQRGRGLSSSGQRRSLSFYVGDVLRLPHPERSLDAVFDFGVLHHLPDWQGGLAEIARVLKPGGVFFLEELYPFLYQNFLTRQILLHPRNNRFRSCDLKPAMKVKNLHLLKYLEHPWLGILGISVKEQGE